MMKKRSREDESGVDSGDDSQIKIPPSIKTIFACVARRLHEQGQSMESIAELFSDSGYQVTGHSLSNHLRSLDSIGSAVSENPNYGRHRSLDAEQETILSGYVLSENNMGNVVDRTRVLEFIRNNFEVELTPEGVGLYLQRLGFSLRTAQSRTAGYQFSVDAMAVMVISWLNRTPRKLPLDKVASVDFTYSGHRLSRTVSYARKGSSNVLVNSRVPSYTNCIVTVVWGDGKNRTPPMLFTLNPLFKTWASMTPKRTAKQERLLKTLLDNNVDLNRIVYMGGEKSSSKYYVGESSELLELFFGHYVVPDDCTIFSDFGNSFKKGNDDVLLNLGFKRHLTYEPAVHQYLSPNDNSLHGRAKKKWRAEVKDHSDDIVSSVTLLRCLDEEILNGKDELSRNLQLNVSTVDENAARELVQGKAEKSHFEALFAYRVWMGQDSRGYVEEHPEGLSDHLDGPYWQSVNKHVK